MPRRADEADEPLRGALIAGKYRTGRVIGRGAMGIVYEASHAELKKKVAVKVIESALAHSDEFLQRFRREARAAGAVESESIVRVFDAGVNRDVGAYMVMEYLEGENLEERLARPPRLAVSETVRIAQQLGHALAKAHAAGVVHRDLKPANVFLTKREDGSRLAKILDFGISLILAPDANGSVALRLTQVGMVVGSPQYSSPEQVQGKDDVDHRTDVWSLGVVVYEMLAGKRAYPEKDNYEDFVQELLHEEPPKLTDVAPWVPPSVAAVVHAAIRHDPAQRLPDCGTFARLLSQAMATTANAPDDDETIVASGAPPSEAEEEPPPSGTIVMAKPSFDTPPDSDDFPTSPNVAPPKPPAVPKRPPPEPPDMGGFLLPLPPPRSQLPTMPSFARAEQARRRTRLRFVLVALAVVVVAVGGATAVVAFYGGP